MARIIYSGIVTKISGSVGGTTFQANAYGFSVKNKPNMVRPNTPFQLQRKLAFARATKLWGGLTTAQRTDWNTWASANPQFAKNNPSSQLSGFAVFVRTHVLNMISTSLGDPAVTAPSYTILPIDTATWVLQNAAGVLTLTSTWGTGGADLLGLVNISRPFTASQNFVGSSPRYMVAVPNDPDSAVITSKYVAQFGVVPAVGQIVNVELQLFNPLNGQVFNKSNQRVTIT